MLTCVFRTCGLDDTCVLCQYCFNEADHEGHQVTFTISQQDCGGVCDCGDSEAWVNEFSCRYHSVENYSNDPLPEDLHKAIQGTISVALDYMVDVFSAAHTAVQKFRGENEVRANEVNSTLSEEVYGIADDQSNHRYTLCLWNDQKHSFLDALNAVARATKKRRQFGQMVTKRIDSIGRGKVVVSKDVAGLMGKKLLMEETGLVNTVRSSRDHFREEMCETIVDWLDDVSKCCINGNYLALREVISEELCSPWNYGTETLRKDPDSILYRTSTLEFSHASVMDEHAALDGPYIPDPVKRLEKERQDAINQGLEYDEPEPHEFWECDGLMDNRESGTSARVQYLIFFDIRLWKSLRLKLRDLYMNVLVSHSEYKMKLGHFYAQLYPQVAELYALGDREPECSIISSLSTQLFTTPSIATDLVKYDYFTHFLAAIFTFFTNQDIGPPQSVRPDGMISMESRMLKNRKFGQLFHDIEYVINRNTDKQAVSGDVRRIQQVADFLLLFQGMSPMRRHKLKHVEYESDVWISFFNAMPYVLQLANVVSSGIEECDEKEAHVCIRAVATLLAKWSFGYFIARMEGSEINEYIEFETAEVQFENMSAVGELETTRASVVSYDIKGNFVSLHHPLHAFLSYMIESYHFKDATELRNLLLPATKDREYTPYELHSDDQILIAIFDYSVRSLALLTQIQVGLWVRNGYSVRSQLHHYREMTLRDSAFRRDLFMVQTALVVMDPAIVMLDMMDKFGLNGSLEEDETVDRSQHLYIVEEFLRYLIGILMERIQLQELPEKEVKRRYIMKEVIQSLTFKDKTFSDMCKNIPSHLANEAMFEDIVYEVAEFKPPSGVRDYGQYRLKPEYHKHFDTHYVHFSSTKIEEAETKRKEILHKETGVPTEAIVVEPPLEKIEKGAYTNLSQFTRTLPFVKMTFDLLTMVYENRTDNQYENVFKHLLHLLHIAALDDVNVGTQKDESLAWLLTRKLFAPREFESDYRSVLSMLTMMINLEQFSDSKAKIQRIIGILASKDGSLLDLNKGRSEEKRSMDEAMDEAATESEFARKKRLGKERQAEIMAKMAKQQQQFAQNNMSLDESEEEEASGESKEDEWVYPESQCILCKMPDDKSSVFGIIGYAMNSNVYRDVPFQHSGWVYEAYGSNRNLDDENTLEDIDNNGSEKWKEYRQEYNEKYKIGPGFPITYTARNCIITSCGHGVHFHCYEQYTKNGRSRGLQFTRNTPEESQKGEFLCPLCKSINNLFLPRLWKSNKRKLQDFLGTTSTFENFYNDVTGLSKDGFFSPNLQFQMLSDRVIEEGGQQLQPHFSSALQFSKTDCGLDDEMKSKIISLLDKSLYQAISRIFNVIADENPAYPQCGLTDTVDVLANTISSIEISLRGVKNPNMMGGIIIDQIPTQSLNCIRTYAELCKCWVGTLTLARKLSNKDDKNGVGVNMTVDMSPLSLSDTSFKNFVRHALITAPGAELDVVQFIKMFFMANISNALLRLVKEVNGKPEGRSEWVTDPLLFEMPCVGEYDDDSMRALNDLVGVIRSAVEIRSTPDMFIWNKPSFGKVLYSMLLKSVTPFLRKCAIFVHSMCGVGYDPYDYMGFGDAPEATKLCEFLGIPSLNETLVEMASNGSPERELFMDWSRTSFVSLSLSQNRIEYPGVIRLLKLPHRLDEFFSLASYATDSQLREIPTDPAICLFCGATVALQMAIFNDDPHGECQKHMERCGKDLGIYMLPKRSAILLLRGPQGSFIEGPYLDLHGESDETLR